MIKNGYSAANSKNYVFMKSQRQIQLKLPIVDDMSPCDRLKKVLVEKDTSDLNITNCCPMYIFLRMKMKQDKMTWPLNFMWTTALRRLRSV